MTLPQSAVDSASLLRFIGGESPADEHVMVTRWMQSHPANHAEVVRLTQAWELTRSAPQDWPTDALWSRIESRIRGEREGMAGRADASRAKPLVLMPPTSKSIWQSVPVRIAAAALLIAGAAGIAAQAGEENETVAAVTDERTYTTQPGERADLVLLDGTKVILGGASSLRIPSSYGAVARELYLDGQAYFDVAPDSTRTLRVHTQRSVAQDLGTRFVVTAFSGDSTEQITVVEGTVAVQGVGDPVVLRANDVGHVSAAGTVKARRNVDPERYVGWMSGVAYFDDAVLDDAVKTLRRQHGVDIRITDPALARRRFTGSIGARTLHVDLGALALLLDARYERAGDTVVLAR